MDHLKTFEAQSNDYYREVSKEDYLAIKWNSSGRHMSEQFDDRDMVDIESHCAKVLSGRRLVVPLVVRRQPVMLNPQTFDQEYTTTVKWGVIELGKFRRYFMTITKIVDKDDEPWWAVSFSKYSGEWATEGTQLFFICDGMWGLRRMIADQVSGLSKL